MTGAYEDLGPAGCDPPPAERQNLLDTFAERPEDAGIWDIAYAWVRAEGDSLKHYGVASDIPAEELIAMADIVRSTNPAERYDLMAQTASNGKLWYDVIEGFSSQRLRQVLQNALHQFVVSNRGAPFQRALDLGAGTGNSLLLLEKNATRVYGIDRNQSLLAIARQRVSAGTVLLPGDISQLPFSNASFDLVTSLGVESSLDRGMALTVYREVARVLMPGGSYVSVTYNYPEKPSEEMDQITQTSKAMLADMICDTVSGGAAVTDRLEQKTFADFIMKLGLRERYYSNQSDDGKTYVLFHVITKPGTASA